MTISIEECEYSKDKYTNLIDSEPMEIGEIKGYNNPQDAVDVFNKTIGEYDPYYPEQVPPLKLADLCLKNKKSRSKK